MVEIEIPDKLLPLLFSPAFQVFAKEKNIEIVGPMDGSKVGTYIWKVGRIGYGIHDPIHSEAKKDVIKWFIGQKDMEGKE